MVVIACRRRGTIATGRARKVAKDLLVGLFLFLSGHIAVSQTSRSSRNVRVFDSVFRTEQDFLAMCGALTTCRLVVGARSEPSD
jgi:hypothetical protein